jgi:hypothetical protein
LRRAPLRFAEAPTGILLKKLKAFMIHSLQAFVLTLKNESNCIPATL